MADINQIKVGSTTYDINDKRISGIATSVASGNANPVSSGAVYAAIQNAGGGSSDNRLIITRDYDDGDIISSSDYLTMVGTPLIYLTSWGYLLKKCTVLSNDLAEAIDYYIHSGQQARSIGWIGLNMFTGFDPNAGGPSLDTGYTCLVLWKDQNNNCRVSILEA